MKKLISFWSLFTIVMVAMLSLSISFVSCSKDEIEEDDFEPTQNVSNQDPEGTIVLNMTSGAENNYYKIGDLGQIHIDVANNFRGWTKDNNYKIGFVTIGKVDGLSSVNRIPLSGWAESAAVVPGTGYIMRYTPTYGGDIQYARIYVVDYLTTTTTDEFGITTGSNSGAVIKYQAPFKGTDETIDLSEKVLTFDAKGGSKELVFTNNNVILFTAESSNSWCSVNKGSNNKVTISVLPSDESEIRTATVTLTTAYDRKTTINITQAGVQPFISINQGGEITASSAEQTIPLEIITNYAMDKLQIVGTTDWCQAEFENNTGNNQETSSTHNYLLNLKLKINTDQSVRTAKLTLTSKDKKAATTLTVKQEGISFTLSPQELTLESGSGSTYFFITSSIEASSLTVTCDSSWCTTLLYDNYSYGSSQWRVNHQANYSTKQRTCNIKIAVGTGKAIATMKVTQKGDVITINGDKDVTVDASATQYDFYFKCNAGTDKLSVDSDVDWCTPSFLYNNRVLTSIKSNPTDVQRTAKITLSHKGEDDNVVITITQKGAEVNMPDTIWFDRNSHTETTKITTNISDFTGWEVTSSKSWCRPSTNGNELTLRLDETTKDRVCTISFKGISKTIKVVQSKYAVGDNYSEGAITGIVGYMSGNQRYIYKEVGTAAWSKENVNVGATDSNNGLYNMTVIKKLPDWKKMYPAFALCEALNVSKVSGWYLPSRYEVTKLPLSGWHWTSTEYTNRHAYVAEKNYSSELLKENEYSVVAVHKF